MGRHASGVPGPPPERRRHGAGWALWIERVSFGALAAAVAAAVARWTGADWTAVGLIGVGVLIVVPTAAWIAGTVPNSEDEDN